MKKSIFCAILALCLSFPSFAHIKNEETNRLKKEIGEVQNLESYKSLHKNKVFINKNGRIYEVKGKKIVLVGVALKFIYKVTKPYHAQLIQQAKQFFVNKGLQLFASDAPNVETVNFDFSGNGENGKITAYCEDHNNDGTYDNALARDFEDDDQEDMTADLDYLCNAQLDYFDDFYED